MIIFLDPIAHFRLDKLLVLGVLLVAKRLLDQQILHGGGLRVLEGGDFALELRHHEHPLGNLEPDHAEQFPHVIQLFDEGRVELVAEAGRQFHLQSPLLLGDGGGG
uniref:(northern house mosquito) hypothetical protein n=1 Tax=Culex pipiens TaxID=7175 RepID=A0A8D7ZXP5_CULPI